MTKMKCKNETCPKWAVSDSEWCEDHMPESEARERLAQVLEEMEAREATYMDKLDVQRDAEEQIHLARGKQDYEETAPEEWAQMQKKVEAKAEQAKLQGELKEMAFADLVKDPRCPQEEIFLEEEFLNIGADGRWYVSLNGVNWPVKSNALNRIPHPFAADYRSKVKLRTYKQKMIRTLSVGDYDNPKDWREWKTKQEYDAALQRARFGLL